MAISAEQKAYEADLRQRLLARAQLLLGADQRVVALLRAAQASIVQQLAGQPADWKLWHLGRLREQIDTVLGVLGREAGLVADAALQDAWKQGEDFVDKPLGAAGMAVEMRLATLDATLLTAMRGFATERLNNVGAEAAGKIAQQIGLVTMGVQTPYQAIKAVNQILGGAALQRATTIVRTEASRAFATASAARLQQAAELVPGLQKQWRRSGKRHSRYTHDLVDGQVVDVDKPFKVPSAAGGVTLMMHPHDPKAPAEQVINCGCMMLPFKKDWEVMTPGAKPFTAAERVADPGKAQLDKQAKAAGLRQEGTPRPEKKSAAYFEAAAGGKHAGFLEVLGQYGPRQIAKAQASLQATQIEHQAKIAAPEVVVPDFKQRDPRYQAGLLAKWQAEIDNAQEQQDVIKGYLDEHAKKPG